jgi:hypothetical protein
MASFRPSRGHRAGIVAHPILSMIGPIPTASSWPLRARIGLGLEARERLERGAGGTYGLGSTPPKRPQGALCFTRLCCATTRGLNLGLWQYFNGGPTYRTNIVAVR